MASVLVTGSSRGIGRATALELAERGAQPLLLTRPSARQTETERLLNERGAHYRTFYADLEAHDELLQVIERIITEAGLPDAVIHNAAVIERTSVVDTTRGSFARQLEVNLLAPFAVTRALLPAMLARGSGRHVYVGSISSTLGTAGSAAYNASKWALLGFMKSLAEELRDSGVTAVAVLPGSVDTEMLEGSGFEPRMSAHDVARTLVHYALDAPPAHNGAAIEMFGV